MNVEIEFTKEYVGLYKKGDSAVFDSQLAAKIIHYGVAKVKPKRGRKPKKDE